METESPAAKGISLSSESTAAAPAAARSKNFWAASPASTGLNNPTLKLSLSAYRRPENAVRLTDADPSRLIHDKYELLDPSLCRTLGHGASSTVRLAHRRGDGQPVAVKTIAKHDALGLWSRTNRRRRGALEPPRDAADRVRKQVKRAPRLEEANVLTTLRGVCPGAVQLLDVYETPQEVQLVLEYCEGGDLFDCIKRRNQSEQEPDSSAEPLVHGRFSELETATVAKTLLDVLHALHSRNIVHRDIKPENVLLVHEDPGENSQLGPVKLTDFGLARLLHGDNGSSSHGSVGSEEHLPMRPRSRAYSCVGSDYYAAPEVHLGAGYDTPVDMYSLGVTLYIMLCGTPPLSTSFFKSEDADLTDEDSSCMASVSDESTHSSHDSLSGLFPSESKISHLAQDFISKMIHPDPEKRMTASEGLKHEWVTTPCAHEDTRAMTRMTSRLSISSSGDNLMNSRTFSFAETESFLRIGPALPVVPPSNSPATKTTKAGPIGQTPQFSRPASPTCDPNAAIGLALADVCSKLAPLANERHLRKQRKHCHAHPHVERIRFKKRARSGGWDEQSKKRRGSCKKKACLETAHRGHLSPNSCASCRICRRFNQSGMSPMELFLPESLV